MSDPTIDAKILAREMTLLRRLADVVDDSKMANAMQAIHDIHKLGFETTYNAACKGKRSADKIAELREELLTLVKGFNSIGAAILFKPRSARAGDFLINYNRGVWAERVLQKGFASTGKYVLVPYGPSTPPMPGETDYLRKVGIFGLITALEGKRPDLLLFERPIFDALSNDLKQLASDGVAETPEDADSRVATLLKAATAAIEVKSSIWLADKRAEGSMSVTLKGEEIIPFDNWTTKNQKPIIFAQVFFDSAYLLSYATMKSCIPTLRIDDLSVIAEGDRKTDKETYRFPLKRHRRFADVPFPTRSKAEFMVVGGAQVAPYINYDGGEATNLRFDVLDEALKAG